MARNVRMIVSVTAQANAAGGSAKIHDAGDSIFLRF
jgi:hypothetical protein